MKGQAMWVVVAVLLQVLGGCYAFGAYPGTFYQMMLRLNKERKYARTAPSPSRLWAILNPAATLGSLSNVPLDSNRVVRRDLELRQVQDSTSQEPLTEGSQPLSGESELPSGESQPAIEGDEHSSGESEPTQSEREGLEPTESKTGGSEAFVGVSGEKPEPIGIDERSESPSEGSQPTNEEPNEGVEPETATEISDVTNGQSKASTEESEPTSEKPESTEPINEVSEPISGESSGGLGGGINEAAETVKGGLNATSEGSKPASRESNTTSGELEPTNNDSESGNGSSSLEGTRVSCGEEVVMPSPPSPLMPTQGFTLKQNLSTPGWEKGSYPEEVECVWNLKVGPECEVGLLLYQVLEGEVLQSPRCLDDYLEFVQPNSHATRYCGPLVNNRDKVSGIDSWHSSQERTTTVRFRSSMQRSLGDRSVSGAPRGFVMEVTYYCWLYNKKIAASTQKNEVSGNEEQQPNEGRKEGIGEDNWEDDDEGSGYRNDSLI